jgi:WD40 repeat protein
VSVSGVRPPPAGDDRGRVATLDEYPTAVALSPDGARLAVMRYAWDTVQVFDVATGAERRMKVPPFADPKRHALGWAVVFSPDGRTLVGLGGNDYPVLRWKNGAVAAWDLLSGDVLWHAEEDGPVRSCAFSADGRRLATGAFPIGDAHVRDMRRGEIYSTLSAPVIGDVALDADGRTLIVSQRTAGADSKAALIVSPLDRPDRASRLPVAGFVRRVVFRPDGRAFVTADDNGDIALWVKTKE